MKGLSLIEAICTIGKQKPSNKVTAIQYEDGSGFKFNYQLDYGPWQFIDLSDCEEIMEAFELLFSISTAKEIKSKQESDNFSQQWNEG